MRSTHECVRGDVMDREGITGTLLLAISAAVLLMYSPDLLTTGIIVVMCVLLLTAYIIGLFPVMQYLRGLRLSQRNMEKAAKVDAQNIWVVIRKMDTFFGRQDMDDVFREYCIQVDEAYRKGEIPTEDVEDYLNDSLFYHHTQRGVMQQVPGTLTGLGILGTFLGLLVGLRSLGFSSETSTIESIQTLLSGVRTAFYTSVAGVIFSIIFTIFYSRLWGRLEAELDRFYAAFHRNVVQSSEVLLREQQLRHQRGLAMRLDRIVEVLEARSRDGGKESGNFSESASANSPVSESASADSSVSERASADFSASDATVHGEKSDKNESHGPSESPQQTEQPAGPEEGELL